ncbi:hypothetical protein PHMEG_0004226 [Phytophthora megakarya]|uniref:Jacalin-type lectin domain-containing protein n=1 Tax=Phytophthora megakarya TaxID=4795 RepID=A0A225WVZ6_9STRA|nr:hypothetical protein PHMEG_0004226 [Phytophthora megakarya]
MKFISQVLVFAATLMATGVVAVEKGVILGPTFGGPHGNKYSDVESVGPGQTVQSITIRASDRVDSVSLNVTNLVGKVSALKHGGGGGDKDTLHLGEGEHITGIEVHWGKYYRKTRVMYIQFTTDKGHIIAGGTPQDNIDKIGKDTAWEGYQLGGFVGFAGEELDSVGAIWTSIQPLQVSLPPVA